ncbi:hypothetical protein BBC27_04895 [Acidithiobacillus ferrivorans]|uniref:Uncharacterized protein n=2 Tax=Acidithiobacillus ferrivorans TaxID=160808 RepID=A0A1B9BUB8_9PROT|nr:hypothetical protein BBC27_04895 [Acidithiobacillus ferrivorans]
MSEGPKLSDDKLGVTGGTMTPPDQFRYANSIRIYSGAGDVILEFGVARPEDGQTMTIKSEGVIGVALPGLVAKNMALQILAQMPGLSAEMVKIAASLGDNNVTFTTPSA